MVPAASATQGLWLVSEAPPPTLRPEIEPIAAPLFVCCILEDIGYYLILDLPPLPWPRPPAKMLLRKGKKQLEETVIGR